MLYKGAYPSTINILRLRKFQLSLVRWPQVGMCEA